MTVNMKPLYDRVVVKRQEKETTTSGGIILTERALVDTFCGEVIAVGKGAVTEKGERLTPQVKVGDVILFAPVVDYSEMDGDDELLIMKENNILAILPSEENVKETDNEE